LRLLSQGFAAVDEILLLLMMTAGRRILRGIVSGQTETELGGGLAQPQRTLCFAPRVTAQSTVHPFLLVFETDQLNRVQNHLQRYCHAF
jgi:hypothetical protein